MSTQHKEDNGEGWVFIVGLIFVSVSIGVMAGPAWGFMAFGIGLMGVSILSFLNG